MHLLLLSLGHDAIPVFLAAHVGKPPSATHVAFLDDAETPYRTTSFVSGCRREVERRGYVLTDVTAGECTVDEFARVLDSVDALYVAGGNTFSLLAGLRRHGAADVLVERVRHGLPYIGCSAGSAVVGPSIEPVALLDDPSDAPDLDGYTGLGLTESTVISHTDGQLPPYPRELIEQTVRIYGANFPLTLIADDEALLVEGDEVRLVPSPWLD